MGKGSPRLNATLCLEAEIYKQWHPRGGTVENRSGEDNSVCFCGEQNKSRRKRVACVPAKGTHASKLWIKHVPGFK